MRKFFLERPWISFLPFLLLYALIIVTQSSDALMGDEGRYLFFANNLCNGFYSPAPPDINLWNGPGYPIFLLPFVAAKVPLLTIRLTNAVLYYFTLLLFNKVLTRMLEPRSAFRCTLLFACYYMPYKSLPFILSETLSIFLIASITFIALLKISEKKKSISTPSALLLALLLALLALTKVAFGMVYLFTAGAFLVFYLFSKNKSYKNYFTVTVLALVFCLPYLFYTYSLTGKIFYWSNAAGMSAYWITNPVQGEFGEWHNDSLRSTVMNDDARALLKSNHEKDYQEIYSYSGVQRDEMFMKYAKRNLQEHPMKFFQNWLTNWGRMFFNYPVSYVPFRISTLGNMLANIPVILLMLYASMLSWRNRKQLPIAFQFGLCLFGIYLAASSLLSAYDRMFYILAPFLGVWISYVAIRFRKTKDAG